MKKKALGILAASALAIAAIGAPVAADSDKAYGKTIKDACGASFGQLRQLSPHPVTPSKGAKNFANPAILAAHGCVVD
jgi:hypothetical protein